MNNPGLIQRFDVTIFPLKQHIGKSSEIKFLWQDQSIEKRFDKTPEQVVIEDIKLFHRARPSLADDHVR